MCACVRVCTHLRVSEGLPWKAGLPCLPSPRAARGPGPWAELAPCPAVSALLSQCPVPSAAPSPRRLQLWLLDQSLSEPGISVSGGLIGRRLGNGFLSLIEDFSTSKLPGGQLDGQGPTRADCVTSLSVPQRSATGLLLSGRKGGTRRPGKATQLDFLLGTTFSRL